MTDTRTSYPLRVDGAPAPRAVSCWLWLVKWLPHLVVLLFLRLAFYRVGIVEFFAILITTRYPRPLFDFDVGVRRWSWQVHYAMAHDRIVWLVGTTDQDPDLSVRPLGFNPKGFLVAILPDAEEAERAAAALRAAGFADRKLRIFTSGQILDDHARYTGQKSLPRRVVAALTDDQESIALYQGHARDGCFALWVHVLYDEEADRAIRGLAGCDTLHIRHYGHRRQSDFYLQRPTS